MRKHVAYCSVCFKSVAVIHPRGVKDYTHMEITNNLLEIHRKYFVRFKDSMYTESGLKTHRARVK